MKFLPPVLLLVSLLFAGCSPLYLLQAAYEEGKILWRREPIDELLKRPDLDRETKEKFETVLAVRRFAKDRLKLRVDGSYSTYTKLDRSVLSYVLMAVPQTDLTPYQWWFFVVGHVPYKGYFSEEAATSEAESFQERGYDTLIRPVQTFSSLGWFDDPLLDHLLKYDKVTLAEVVLHELFHSTLFVSGAVGFNESLANFVGTRGAIDFTRERFGEGSLEHLQAVREWEEELRFARFINHAARSLRDLYQGDRSKEEKLRLREEVFSRSQEEWVANVTTKPASRYREYGRRKLNNAVIAHFLLYLGSFETFESLYQSKGKDLPGLIKLIIDSTQGSDEPLEAVKGLSP